MTNQLLFFSGTVADLFTGVLQNGYGPPPGFCFDIFCHDTSIVVSVTSVMIQLFPFDVKRKCIHRFCDNGT